jgi:hypothetical protein
MNASRTRAIAGSACLEADVRGARAAANKTLTGSQEGLVCRGSRSTHAASGGPAMAPRAVPTCLPCHKQIFVAFVPASVRRFVALVVVGFLSIVAVTVGRGAT